MTATFLSGQGGYEPGKVEKRIQRTLTSSEGQQFRRALDAANGLRMPAVECNSGYDGAMWILEAAEDGKYRYVNRWSPKSGPANALGKVMLSFTGWHFQDVY